jgi:CRISPR-associated endonuclease/helicase Cas3
LKKIAKRKIIDGQEFTETIEEHGQHALNIYHRLDNLYDLDNRFLYITQQCIQNTKQDISMQVLQFIKDAIYQHDNGKINKEFQKKIRGMPTNGDDCHSGLSAYLYLINKISYIDENYTQKRTNALLKVFAIHISYLIARHHTKLKDFDYYEYYSKAQNYINYQNKNFDIQTIQNYCYGVNDNIYILDKLIYSVLTTCDTIASYEFQTNKKFDFATITEKDILNYNTTFENNNIVKSIRNHTSTSDINKLRSEIFLKAENRVGNEHITFLEAQTGSGKTLTSLGIIKKLLNYQNIKRILYIAPFKTLMSQTEKTIQQTFGNKYLVKNEDIEIPINLEDLNYDRDLLNYTLSNNNIVLTSHIQLFNTLFGVNKASIMGLYGLMDSVIILDEIQAYKNAKWLRIINLLARYSKLLNIRFIIMSATLPPLDKLLNIDIDYKYILQEQEVNKYRKFFNKRVKTDFSMLSCVGLEEIYSAIDKKIEQHADKNRFIIGLIKLDTSFVFYKRFKQKYQDYDVLLLNGCSNAGTKEKIINRINDKNNHKKTILIATQVVEAGTDISMDVGFKDYGILDSDIQFKGRIARNFETDGMLYVFDYDDYLNVYRDDLRKKYTLADKKGQEMFVTENFKDMYEANFDLLQINDTIPKLKNIKFQSINDKMKLIDTQNIKILINTPEAQKLYTELQEMRSIDDFSQRKILQRKKKIEMQKYIIKYNIYKNHPKQKSDLYVLDNYKPYIENNEFGSVFYLNKFRDATIKI